MRRNGKEEGSQPSGYSPVRRRALPGPLTPLCAFGLKHRGWPGSVSPKVLGIAICRALGASAQGVSGLSWRAEATAGRPGARLGASARRHRPDAAAARGPAGLTKGSVGRGARARDGSSAAPRARRGEGRPARCARWLLDGKSPGCLGLARRAALGRGWGGRGTCLAPRRRSRTSPLRLLLAKHLEETVCAGRAAGWAGARLGG